MQTSTTRALPDETPSPQDSTADYASSVRETTLASPVFVDGSGRRRKNWRRLTIAVVAILCGYACLLGIGFAGGPIPPAALLPIPGIPGNGPTSTAPASPTAGDGTWHATTSDPAKDTSGAPRPAAPTRADGAGSDAANSPRTTAGKPTAPANGTPTASGTTVPTTPVGTTPVTPSSTSPSTHGPQATPPSHSHSKAH